MSEAPIIELKNLGEAGEIEGYGAVFGNKDLTGDIIRPGAFARSLKERPAGAVAMLWAHDGKRPIGVWEEAYEDSVGLRVKGRLLTETRDGSDALAFAKAGAARGLSIGFKTVRASRDAVQRARVLEDVDLFEISLLPVQANSLARVHSVKSYDPDRARRLVAQLNAAAAALRAGDTKR